MLVFYVSEYNQSSRLEYQAKCSIRRRLQVGCCRGLRWWLCQQHCKLREINDIMNNAVTGWMAFSNPRYFPEPYRRQKGWERIRNDNEPDNSMDGFQEIPTEEMEQLGLPEEWLKQK